MARPQKFPGLQQKFDEALRKVLAERTLKSKDILAAIQTDLEGFSISVLEYADLERNFPNYMDRSKNAGFVTSNGPWGGYALTAFAATSPSQSGPAIGQGGPANNAQQMVGGPTTGRTNKHWESLLHLPLTVVLSHEFSAAVRSLPTATDQVKWGNPDMLMVRPSAISRLQEYNEKISPDVFRMVDVTPEAVIASLEVKYDLARSRSAIFGAIAEAAANSRWANEAWLVFVDRSPTTEPLDSDVIGLARTVEVGLIEVRIDETQGAALRAITHFAAPTRATLRVEDLSASRGQVLLSAQSLLQEWSQDGTFLDNDGAAAKALMLLFGALKNIRIQKGFSDRQTPLATLLELFQADKDDAAFVKQILAATLRTAGIAGGMKEGKSLVSEIVEASASLLVKREADELQRSLTTFDPDLTLP